MGKNKRQTIMVFRVKKLPVVIIAQDLEENQSQCFRAENLLAFRILPDGYCLEHLRTWLNIPNRGIGVLEMEETEKKINLEQILSLMNLGKYTRFPKMQLFKLLK